MKILIVGSDYQWSIERIYLRELKAYGLDVDLFPAQNIFYDAYYKGIISKLLIRSGLINIYNKINKLLLEKVQQANYQLIWVFKGMEIFPSTLELLKKQKCKLINFNPDNPFIFSGKGSGNKNVTNSVSLFDIYLTYDKWVKEKIENDFKIRSELIPFVFDENAILEDELTAIKEVNAVCFMGNPDAYRAKIILEILNCDLSIHLYGNKWDTFIQHPHAFIHRPVYGKDFLSTLRKYRIQLNIMRAHNINSHNMRSVEIPGVGGLMLAPNTSDHKQFFTEGDDVFLFNDEKELITKIREILEMSEEKVRNIRMKAREKVLKEFTYSRQVNQLIHLFSEI